MIYDQYKNKTIRDFDILSFASLEFFFVLVFK